MLPLELLNEIVNWLFDDRPSLMALSCTAQCLRAHSQALLFHDLVLSPNAHPPSSYIPLLEMSPHILTYVRRLRIIAGDLSDPSTPRRVFVHHDDSLRRLIRALTNVDAIALMRMLRLEEFTGIGCLLPIIASPTVRTVSLRTVFLPTPQSLFTLLSYFPSVSSLRFHNVHAMGIASHALDAGNIVLTEIAVSTGMMISSALRVSLFKDASSGWSRYLRSLVIERYSVRDLFMISGLISRLPNLVTLTFKRPTGDISHSNIQKRLATKIHVYPLQKIRSLRVSVTGVTSPLTRWWFGHLSQATAVSLEYLEIDFLYADVGAASEMQPSTVAWKEVEVSLMCLPKLQSLSMKTVIDGNIRTICSSES